MSETDGSVTVRLHRPPETASAPYPAVLWIHGGGYVIGKPGTGRCGLPGLRPQARCGGGRREVPTGSGAPVPGCARTTVTTGSNGWPSATTSTRARIAIGGASAGGGLAAALALLARERGVVTPRLQLLSYPMLDDRTVLRTDLDERYFRLWNNEANRFGWTSYLGGEPGAPDVSPLAAPAREENLSGLPPAWIGVGTLDLFFDEDMAYAKRLRTAGVPCELHVVEGAFHGFDSVAPKARITRAYRVEQVQALASALGVTG